MPQTCTVCRHSGRGEVDSLLVAGVSLRNIAERFGLSVTALHRHEQEHLPEGLIKAQAAAEIVAADDLLVQVLELEERTVAILERAEKSGDLRTALAAIGQARGNLELLARMLAAAIQAEHESRRVTVEDIDREIARLEAEVGGRKTH